MQVLGNVSLAVCKKDVGYYLRAICWTDTSSFRREPESTCFALTSNSSYHNFLKDTYKSGNVETLELIDRAREVLQKDLNTKEAAYREFRRKTPMLWKGKDGNGTTVHQDRLFNVDAQRSVLRMRSAEIQSTLVAIESALKGGRSYLEILPMVSGELPESLSPGQAPDHRHTAVLDPTRRFPFCGAHELRQSGSVVRSGVR